jgi:hypothetical protein
MNPELQRVFESISEDTPRSRLEPYRELILRWRRQGRSYRRIKVLLAERCSLNVGTMTLHDFVRRRSRPRKAQSEIESPPEGALTDQPIAPQGHTKLSPDEVARQRALIQDLRSKPVVVSEVRKRFVYDPDEPLILEKHKQES